MILSKRLTVHRALACAAAFVLLACGACSRARHPRQTALQAMQPGMPWARGVIAANEAATLFGGLCITADGQNVMWMIISNSSGPEFQIHTPQEIINESDAAVWRAKLRAKLEQVRCRKGILMYGDSPLTAVEIDAQGLITRIVDPTTVR